MYRMYASTLMTITRLANQRAGLGRATYRPPP